MTKKQIIAIADAAYGDGLVARGDGDGDTLALFIRRELSDVYERRASAAEQLEAARRAMCIARRELQAVERAFETAIYAADTE